MREPLDIFVFVGAGLIITGILWNLRSEARRPLPVSSRRHRDRLNALGPNRAKLLELTG